MAIPALGLLAVTATGVVAPWMVYLAVFAMGAVNAVDNPTRQSFVIEMVGPDRVVNAVSLNSVIVQAARIVGPAIAGLLIAGFGVVPCFALNALTFVAMIVALWGMDPAGLHAAPPVAREPGRDPRRRCATSRATPELAVPLALMALVGTLGFNFQVVLPLLAKFSFGGGATTYAALVSAMARRLDRRGARQRRPRPHRPAADRRRRPRLRRPRPARGGDAGAGPRDPGPGRSSAPPRSPSRRPINSTLQLAVSPEMRGRVMALYSVVFLGSTPIGGPLAGWLSQAYDPRVALLLAGITGLSAAWAAHICFARTREQARRLASEPAASSELARWSWDARRTGGWGGTQRTLLLLSVEALPATPSTLSRCSRLTSGTRAAASFGGLLFEFDPGVELLHDRERQALLDLLRSSFRSPGPPSSRPTWWSRR